MPDAPVLYVEDEPNDVFFMQLAFQRAGTKNALKAVDDGQQAVEYLAGRGIYADRAQHPFPILVLLDLNLPLRSGRDVLQWIRQQPQFSHLPVVVFTSSDQEKDKEETKALGADAYFSKPSRVNDVIKLVKIIEEKWLQAERARAADSRQQTFG